MSEEIPNAVQFAMPLPDPLLSLNKRLHHMARARHTKRQRLDAYLVAVDARHRNVWSLGGDVCWDEERVRVDVEIRPRKGMKRHDDTAIWEAMKPIFDGLEDAGWVADDKQLVVGELTWAKERTAEILLTLTALPR